MSNYEVRYESTLWLNALNLEENSDAAECMTRHRWNKFASAIPDFFLTNQVKEFYDTIRKDEATGNFTSSITYYTNSEHTHASTVEINMTEIARQCFGLPTEGANPFDISVEDTEAITTIAMEPDAVIEKSLKMKVFKTGYKTILKVIQKCFIGMLGSGDQVSQPHKQILAALMQPGPFDWNTAYHSSSGEEERQTDKGEGWPHGQTPSSRKQGLLHDPESC